MLNEVKHLAGREQLSVSSYQSAVISQQLSVISYQLSVSSYQGGCHASLRSA